VDAGRWRFCHERPKCYCFEVDPELDHELVAAAREIIRARYKPDWHAVGCAIRTRSGRIHRGVHPECYVGRVTLCAEAIAIGRAVTDGDGEDIETIVAVRQSSSNDAEPRVVAPCGMCREMISDYAPSARVIMQGPEGMSAEPVSELLPDRYTRS
jgi:cytidine deaminase